MFVSWLELTTLGTTAARDIDDTGVPIARTSDGVYLWHPETDGPLVIAQHGEPSVDVHALAAAVANRASALGMTVLRPKWEGTDPTTEDISTWVGPAEQTLRSRLGVATTGEVLDLESSTDPFVFLVPRYENTYAGDYNPQPANLSVEKLVVYGSDVDVYPVVSYRVYYGAAALGDPWTLPTHLFSPFNTVISVMDGSTHVGITRESAFVLTTDLYDRDAAPGVEVDPLSLDQIARGRWE